MTTSREPGGHIRSEAEGCYSSWVEGVAMAACPPKNVREGTRFNEVLTAPFQKSIRSKLLITRQS